MKQITLLIGILLLTSSILFAQETKKEYYENGNLKSIIEYNEEGKENGEGKTYYENGNIFEILNFKNGVLDGLIQTYFENGQLENSLMYSNGKPNGIFKKYHSNGNISALGNFEKEKRVGKWLTYYEDGQQASMTNFNNEGLKEGKEIIYFNNGNLKTVIEYRDGLKNGFKKTYTDGKLSTSAYYEDGNPVKESFKHHYINLLWD